MTGQRAADLTEIARVLLAVAGQPVEALAAALDQVLPIGVDPALTFEWCGYPPAAWPSQILAGEYGRWRRGARDAAARAAVQERHRRAGPARKTCSRCRRSLPRAAFDRDRTRADGLVYRCRDCRRRPA